MKIDKEKAELYVKETEKGEFWTQKLYKTALEELKLVRKYPIVICSYNNPRSRVAKYFSDIDWPVYIIVRTSQYEEYYRNTAQNIVVLPEEDKLIDSVSKVRKYCLELFKDYTFFMIDDDTYKLSYQVFDNYYENKGKYRSRVVKDADLTRVLAMWQVIHQKLVDRYDIGMSTILNAGLSFLPKMSLKEYIRLYSGNFACPICITSSRLLEKGVNFRENSSHEDIDLAIQCLEKRIAMAEIQFRRKNEKAARNNKEQLGFRLYKVYKHKK